MSKITARHIADKTGTSLASVTRAFQPDAPISESLRSRILAAARELGYQTPAGRSLSRLASGAVSLVAGDLSNPFYATATELLAQALHARGKRLVLHTIPPGETVDLVMKQVLDYRADAAIVTSARMSSQIARACRKQNLPVILFNRVQPDMQMTAVTCDNYDGGRQVARRLLAAGCRRIGHVTGLADTSTHLERARGFLDELAAHGQAPVATRSGGFSYAGSREAVQALLGAGPQPDALFCENDVMALAAIDEAKAQGLRLPEDLRVIGFDDIPMASWESYSLTTVRQPIRQMVAEVLDLIDAMTAGRAAAGVVRILPVTLKERTSG